MLVKQTHIIVLILIVILPALFFANFTHSLEVPTVSAVPVEMVLSEFLTSGVLSYYKGDPFKTFSAAAFKSILDDSSAQGFGINALYMGMIAESTYLFGSLLGHEGLFGATLGGAYLPPIALYTLTEIFTMDTSKASAAARLGVALTPLTSALAFHWSESFEGFERNTDNPDSVIAQILGSYYGTAGTNIILESSSIGVRNMARNNDFSRLFSTTCLGISSGLYAYGIGELRGSGHGSLHSTLLSAFTASMVGATAGAHISKSKNDSSYWLDGYQWGTIIFSDTTAPIGYLLFQPDRKNSKLAQVIGGYYGSALVGGSMELLGRSRYINTSDKKFALTRSTAMSLGSGFANNVVGNYYEEDNGSRPGRAMLGSLAAPLSGFLLTSYIGIPEGYDEMYIIASFFSPITSLLGYHFPSDDFRSSKDNVSVRAAEIFGGYLTAGITSLVLNQTGYDIEKAWSSWKRSVVRCTILPLVSACTVYALGEEYGSGRGKFLDSLKGSFISPAVATALPLTVSLLNLLDRDKRFAWKIAQRWNEACLLGVFLSPIFAAHFYNSSVENSVSRTNNVANSKKVSTPRWELRFPVCQIRF